MTKRSEEKKLLSAYLKKLGSKGGKTRAAKYSSEQLSEWAKKGGRPKKGANQGKSE